MNGKKINEFPSGSGTLSDDDIFLMMDSPLASGITKSLSLGVLKENVNELVRFDLTTLSGIVDTKQPSGVYASGVHSHVASDITDFNAAMSGVLINMLEQLNLIGY